MKEHSELEVDGCGA